jgi:beta-lactam-binding protein with PASTA domain
MLSLRNVCLLLLTFLMSVFTWAVEVQIDSGQDAIHLQINSGPVTLTEESGLIRPEVEGCEPYSTPGAPMVPQYIINLALPPNADPASVSVTVDELNTEAQVLPEGARVVPGPPIGHWDGTKTVLTWDHPDQVVDGFDMTVYGEDAFYPAESFSGGASGYLRKWNVGTLIFFPVRYNPVSGMLDVVRNASVTVSFSLMKEEAPEEVMNDTAMDDEASRLFANFAHATSWYPVDDSKSISGTYDYVILTTNSILSKTQYLASLETYHEIDHTVLTVTEDKHYDDLRSTATVGGWGGGIGDTAAENLRNWLKTNWASLGIEYVLLVGNPHPDTGDMAMKKTRYRDREDDPSVVLNVATDMYFAELTGNWNLDGDSYFGELVDDQGPGGIETALDVSLGRIPVYSTDASGMAALESILTKIITYATAGGDLNWRKKVLLPVEPSDDATTGTPLMEKIRTDYVLPNSLTAYRIYDEDYGLSPELTPCTSEGVKEEWKKAYGLVVWHTHGSEVHAAHVFGNWMCNELDNTHPSFVFQGSCLNGKPYVTDNLGYSLLKHGAIATISGTEVTKYWVGDSNFLSIMGNASVGQHYAKCIINGLSAGDALRQAKIDSQIANLFTIYPNYGSGQNVGWTNFLTFTLYGDPGVGLYDNGTGAPPVAIVPSPVALHTALGHDISSPVSIATVGPGVAAYTLTDSADWLYIDPPSGVAMGDTQMHTLTGLTASMPPGFYTSLITVTSPDSPNSPLSVPVKLTIYESAEDPPEIGCTLTAQSYIFAVGQTVPKKDFQVYANGEGALYCSIGQGEEPASWLSILPTSGLAYGTERMDASLIFDTASLPIGMYSTEVIITGSQTPLPPNAPLNIPVTLQVTPALADALDAPELTWETSGTATWNPVLDRNHDGVDAVIPGSMSGISSTGTLLTTVHTPGILRFFWKTVFPIGTNVLKFYVDGALVETLSATADWAEVVTEIAGGPVILKWEYTGRFTDEVYACLDEVSFTPFDEPYMEVNPRKISVAAKWNGPSVTVPVWIWNAGGGTAFELSAEEFAPELTVINAVGPVDASGRQVEFVFDVSGLVWGDYTGTVTFYGVGAVNSPVTVSYKLEVTDIPVSIPEALDAPEMSWRPGVGSETMWMGRADSASCNGNAAMIRFDPGEDYASLQTTVEGPGYLNFAWRASNTTSECRYYFSVDNEVVREMQFPCLNYLTEEVQILPGSHELVWAVRRPDGVNPLYKLDNVSYDQHFPSIGLSVSEINVACQPGQIPALTTFEIWNEGTGVLEYQLSENASWFTLLPASGSSQGEHDSIRLVFSAQKLGVGIYHAEIQATMVGVAGGDKALTMTIPVTLEVGTRSEMTVEAKIDNTLYQNDEGDTSNGAGPTIITGTYGGAKRRGLLRFDVAGSLPENVVITGAQLDMDVLGAYSADTVPVTLYEVLKDWGEGVSSAVVPNDLDGDRAEDGDATWQYAIYNFSYWTVDGGDFEPDTLASTWVGGPGTYSWGPTEEMTSLVRSWYESPSNNFGWLLHTGEALKNDWKRFASSEYGMPEQRPRITITFLAPPALTAIVPDVVGKEQANAELAITDSGLIVGTITEEYSETVAQGMVLSQDPVGDTPVVLDSLVDLTLSAGLAPVTVPDMRGLRMDEVAAALSSAGLVEGAVKDTASTYDEGLLARHEPTAGTVVPRDSAVDLYYSTGSTGFVQVPDLIGTMEYDLKQKLTEAWLSGGKIARENSDTIPPGMVIDQVPPAGEWVKINEEVDFLISLGPVFVEVPDVIQRQEGDARAALETVGLVVGTVSDVPSIAVPAGLISGQNPEPGIMVQEGTVVDLTRSILPEKVEVPDVIGKKEAEAVFFLENVLLTVGKLEYEYSDTVEENVVMKQGLEPGSIVDPGTAVDLVVSLGVAPEGEGEIPAEGEIPTEGEGEIPAEGEGETPSEGEGEMPTEGEGEVLPEGEGEMPAEGEGEIVPEGEGDIQPEGEGEIVVEGEGEFPPEGEVLPEGEMPAEGEGEILPEGEGETPAEGEGEIPAEGEGEAPAEGEGEIPAEGEGELRPEGAGETPADGEGEIPAEGEGDAPP